MLYCEMLLKPRPRRPSNLPAAKARFRGPKLTLSTMAKSWLETSMSPTLTVSEPKTPSTGPEPYCTSYLRPSSLKVLDFVLSYLLCSQQVVKPHFLPGTQRLEEPVSKITVKSWPPREI